MDDQHHPTSWSQLPREILLPIFSLLQTRSDHLSFRSVCKNWRTHSLPPSPNILFPTLPHQIPTFNNPYLVPISNNGTNPLIVTTTSILRLTPLSTNQRPSWLVMAEEVHPGKLQLRHPITGKLFNDLPVNYLDATHFDAFEISLHYNVRNSNIPIMKLLLHDEYALMLPTNNTVGALTIYNTNANNANYGMMSFYSSGVRLSDYEGSCTISPNWDDIVNYNGMNLGLEIDGQLTVFDYQPSLYPPFVIRGHLIVDRDTESMCQRHNRRRKRLVIHPLSGKLHLVVMRGFTRWCCVYVLNEQCARWDVVESLGDDIVLFVGVDHCFFAQTSVYPGNCIVFANDSFPVARRGGYRLSHYCHDVFDAVEDDERIWVYHLEDGEFRVISLYPELFQMICLPSSSWFS